MQLSFSTFLVFSSGVLAYSVFIDLEYEFGRGFHGIAPLAHLVGRLVKADVRLI